MSLTHHLYTFDGAFLMDITAHVQKYKHELTNFGPHVANFAISTDDDLTTNGELLNWYLTWLMVELVTIDRGQEVWRGYIWDLTLDLAGFVRQKSMKRVRNRVKISKRDTDDASITHYTNWFEDTESQDLYGIHEYVKALDGAGGITYTDQAAMAQQFYPDAENVTYDDHDYVAYQIIESYAYPLPAYSGFAGTEQPSLSVIAVGRATVADRVVLSDGYLSDALVSETDAPDGTVLRDSGLEASPYDILEHAGELTVSQEIRRIVNIISTQGGWFYELDISTHNQVITAAGVNSQTSAISRLRELELVPDLDGNEMQIYVTNDGGFIYRQKPTEPEYYLYPDGLKHANGEMVGWRARVAPIQIVDPVMSMSSNVTVFIPERVSVANEEARFGPLERTWADLHAANRANKDWVDRAEKKREKAGEK